MNDSKITNFTVYSNRTEKVVSCPNPLLIGVCGGTASGKTSVCRKIIELLSEENKKWELDQKSPLAILIHQDSFYRETNWNEEEISEYNFDHPSSFDFDLIIDVLTKLKKGESVQVPLYDHKNCTRKENVLVLPARVIFFEGILTFESKTLREMFDMKIFVDCDNDTRLSRRVLRDMDERQRELDFILNQYIKFVKPGYDNFIQPSKQYADIIIPRGVDNLVAIDLIVQYTKDQCLPNKENTLTQIHESIHSKSIRPH